MVFMRQAPVELMPGSAYIPKIEADLKNTSFCFTYIKNLA
jgi:hypothetical protein